MRQVERGDVEAPDILDAPFRTDGKSELERNREARAENEELDFIRYKTEAVKKELARLFHGKCAYCESFYAGTQPVDVEHYRPKGEVDGEPDHEGYWWLGANWENLLPSCIDCNRKRRQKTPQGNADGLASLSENAEFDRQRTLSTGKATAFPLAKDSPRAFEEDDDLEAEVRLLIDPTRENPADDIAFYVDRDHIISLVYPQPRDPQSAPQLPEADEPHAVVGSAEASDISVKGAVSIQIYGLNRLGLVQARTRVLRDLEFLLETALNLGTLMEEVKERHKRDRAALAAMDESGAPDQVARDRLVEDLRLDKRLEKGLRRNRDALLHRMREMTSDHAPYSAVAKAWVRAYLDS